MSLGLLSFSAVKLTKEYIKQTKVRAVLFEKVLSSLVWKGPEQLKVSSLQQAVVAEQSLNKS